MSEEQEKFEGWAKLELLGHRVIYGRLSEQEIAGRGFIRVDVPGANGNGDDLTQFYSPSAIYCISPVSEDIGRKMSSQYGSAPVSPYEMPKLTDERRSVRHEEEDEEGMF